MTSDFDFDIVLNDLWFWDSYLAFDEILLWIFRFISPPHLGDSLSNVGELLFSLPQLLFSLLVLSKLPYYPSDFPTPQPFSFLSHNTPNLSHPLSYYFLFPFSLVATFYHLVRFFRSCNPNRIMILFCLIQEFTV